MRISEKTPVMAVVLLVLAVAAGLGFWYIDVRHQAQTELALVQTRDAFERFERERKAGAEAGRPTGSTDVGPTPSPAHAPAATAPAAPVPPATQRASADANPATRSPDTTGGGSQELNYLLAALLATTVIALGLAGSSYRLVRRERRARMEFARAMREPPPERATRFDASEGNIIDAEPLDTVSEDTPAYSPEPKNGLDRLREWLEQSSLPALLLQPSGEVRAVNGAFIRITGYTVTELPNLQSWLGRVQRIPPDQQPAARDALRARFTDAQSDPTDITVWTRAGEPRHWIAYASALHIDADDTVWILLAADVTEGKKSEHAAVERAEQARHEAEDLAAVYRGAPIGLAVLDAQLRFLRVNEKLAEMNGLRVADHLGKPLRKLLPHVAAAAEPVIEAVLQSGTPSGDRWITVRTPANPKIDRHWAVRFTPLKDSSARVTHVALAAEDVTEHHAAEAQTRESEAALRAILEHVAAPICVKDAQGRYVYANPAYEAFVQAAPGQLRGRMDHDVLPWETADRLHDTDDEALAAARSVESEGSMQLRNTAVHYTASKTALRDSGGKPYAVCAVYADWTARQHAEHDMKMAEARYRSIFETSPQPMFVDRDNKLVHVNAACVRLLAARDASDLLGKSILEFIQQPGHKPFQERIQRALRRKSVDGALDVKIVRLDGTVLDVEVECAVYETTGERAVQIIVRDVTPRKRADEALREREARLSNALENMPALIRLAGASGDSTYWNAQWQRYTGVPTDQALGLRWMQHVHADDGERVARALRDTGTQREPVALEYRLRDRSGAYRWVLDATTPRHDDAGAYLGHVSCVIDIDERKRMEESLRSDAERFRATAERAPAPLWTEGAQRTESVNAAMRDRLGLDAEASLDWTVRIHPDDREAYTKARVKAVRDGAVAQETLRVQGADGEYRSMIATLAGRDDAPGIVGSLTDITELLHAERAARSADARRDALIAALAADLRTPLEPLRHAAEVLRITSAAEPRAREASDIIVRHAQYLARLLEDALDMSHMLGRRLSLERAPIEAGDVVHRAAEAARPLIEARGLALSISLPGGRAQLYVDAHRVVQSITRLLDYCARRAGHGASIALAAEEKDGAAHVHITVDRLAMTEREIEALLSRASTDRFEEPADGLAVPLARRLLELQDATLSAARAGSGVRVTLRLPIYDASTQAAHDAGARVPNGHRRVLVVDRDPDTAASLRMLLQLQGHDVRIATDRDAALPAARDFHPDTVLIDSAAGFGEPAELVRALRLLPETAHAALLCLGTEEAPRDSEQNGLYDHYLVKPVEPHVLQRLLAQTSPTVH